MAVACRVAVEGVVFADWLASRGPWVDEHAWVAGDAPRLFGVKLVVGTLCAV